MRPASKLGLSAAAIAVLLSVNFVFEHGFGDFQINPYYARIINLVGINTTLAVSLNLINGLAGQFSAIPRLQLSAVIRPRTHRVSRPADRRLGRQHAGRSVGASIVMIPSLAAGALAAAVAGCWSASHRCA